MDRREDRQQGQAQPPNRLNLNLGFMNNHANTAEAARAYPTTPSTFPQPVFNNAYGQRETWGTQQPTGPTGYGQMNYFTQNPYAQSNAPPNPAMAPGAAQYRNQGYTNDATNGLVHQFSHQNLGGNAQRTQSPYRPPQANGVRSRTAGQQGTTYTQSSELFEEDLPLRKSDKYPDNIYKRSKVANGLVSSFFRENVQRARDRNTRAKAHERICDDPNIPAHQKEQARNQLQLMEAQYLRFLRTRETPDNYSTIKIIGKGAFGEVKLVSKKADGRIYALKSLVKTEMFKRDQLAHVRAERDILAESNSPWVVKLYNTFQDTTFLYMLMEFLPGGDLMTMLIKYEVFTEDITRFYMAQLVSAIAAVHKLGFIHRDIKPDNVLLDRHGHVKLTDFGLSTGFQKEHDASYYAQLMSNAKPSRNSRANRQSVTLDQIQLTVSNRTAINTWRQSRRRLAYSTVGTPDYIAPEIFTGQGYDRRCDWWSVGAIMYECQVGWPPFCAEETNETYRKIVAWKKFLTFPPEANLSQESSDFMSRLMSDVAERLGNGGAEEIQLHPFFRGVDWSSLRKIRAPFEPNLSSAIDTTYFPIDEIPQQDTSAAVREKERQERAMRGEAEESAEMSLPFVGYTFKRFDSLR